MCRRVNGHKDNYFFIYRKGRVQHYSGNTISCLDRKQLVSTISCPFIIIKLNHWLHHTQNSHNPQPEKNETLNPTRAVVKHLQRNNTGCCRNSEVLQFVEEGGVNSWRKVCGEDVLFDLTHSDQSVSLSSVSLGKHC